MNRLNYRQIPAALSDLRSFVNTTGSMRGVWKKAPSHSDIALPQAGTVPANGWYYVVYSYDTQIALYNPTTGETFTDKVYYSKTTSRQQTLCHAWLTVGR